MTRAVARLEPGGPSPRRAYTTLNLNQRRRALTHGDWHLGQLLHHDGAWTLIDPDDLGCRATRPWDLARPAAWFANGLMDPAGWDRLTRSYLRAGGTASSPATTCGGNSTDRPAR